MIDPIIPAVVLIGLGGLAGKWLDGYRTFVRDDEPTQIVAWGKPKLEPPEDKTEEEVDALALERHGMLASDVVESWDYWGSRLATRSWWRRGQRREARRMLCQRERELRALGYKERFKPPRESADSGKSATPLLSEKYDEWQRRVGTLNDWGSLPSMLMEKYHLYGVMRVEWMRGDNPATTEHEVAYIAVRFHDGTQWAHAAPSYWRGGTWSREFVTFAQDVDKALDAALREKHGGDYAPWHVPLSFTHPEMDRQLR